MTEKELEQFVDAVVQASRFSPDASSNVQDGWRKTILANGGGYLLREKIKEVEKRKAA